MWSSIERHCEKKRAVLAFVKTIENNQMGEALDILETRLVFGEYFYLGNVG